MPGIALLTLRVFFQLCVDTTCIKIKIKDFKSKLGEVWPVQILRVWVSSWEEPLMRSLQEDRRLLLCLGIGSPGLAGQLGHPQHNANICGSSGSFHSHCLPARGGTKGPREHTPLLIVGTRPRSATYHVYPLHSLVTLTCKGNREITLAAAICSAKAQESWYSRTGERIVKVSWLAMPLSSF